MTDSDSQYTLASLEKPSTLPVVEVEKADAGLLVGGGIAGLFIGVFFGLGTIVTLPLIIGGVVGAGSILVAKPSTLSGPAYLKTVVGSARMPDEVPNGDPDESTPPESLTDRLETNETTREKTHVKRYYPRKGVIRRDDGRLIACMKVEPQSMDFSEQAGWEHVTNTLEHFTNNDLEFKITPFVTSREFPIDDHLKQLEQRRDDTDVQENPTLDAIIDDITTSRRERLEEANTKPKHLYLIVEVEPSEVLSTTVGETTGAESLAQIPVIGDLVGFFVSKQAGLTEEDKEQRMFEELQRRLRTIQRSWLQNVTGAEGRRVPLSEWLPLFEEYFFGERRSPDDGAVLRTAPIVSGPDKIGDPEVVAELASVAPEDVSYVGEGTVDDQADGVGGDGTDDDDPAGEDGADDGREDLDRETAEMVSEVVDDDRLAELHQRQLAPDGFTLEDDYLKVGEQYCQVMFVEGWGNGVFRGALRHLFTRPDIEFDLTIHITPLDRETALKKTKRKFRSQKGDANIQNDELEFDDKQSEAANTYGFYRDIKNGQDPFRVSLYVVARADDLDTLKDHSRELRAEFSDRPVNMTLKTVKGKREQLLGFESAAPVGKNVLRMKGETDPTEYLLGRSVGALLASFHDNDALEEDGIEFGTHAYNRKPVIKDSFGTGKNYNWVVLGDSGSGKTYSSSVFAERELAQDNDTRIIFIDPMQNFEGVAQALGADPIRVGGQMAFNPLEIRAPDRDPGDIDVDLLRKKIQDVLSLFDNFAYEQQGLENGVGKARSLLSAALKETYTRAGIETDPETHSNPSPTITDLLDVLEEMADEPGEWVLRTDKETDSIETYASQLISLLRPFIEGEYAHLSNESEFELGTDDVIYMDMSEEEGRSGGGGGLMMQLVFSEVYERAKATDKKCIIIVDEARFFMRHATNLEFLGQRVRHSRHFDTSIRFVTQEISDFFDHDESEAIINNSAVKVFHQLDEIEQWQETFDLNERQVEYVKSAATGEEGYSEALLRFADETYPLQIRASDVEHEVVEFDANENTVDDLPGSEGPGSNVLEVRELLEQQARIHREHLDQGGQPEIVAAWNEISGELRRFAGLLDEDGLLELLQQIHRHGMPADEALAAAAATKMEELAGDQAAFEIAQLIRRLSPQSNVSPASRAPSESNIPHHSDSRPDDESSPDNDDSSERTVEAHSAEQNGDPTPSGASGAPAAPETPAQPSREDEQSASGGTGDDPAVDADRGDHSESTDADDATVRSAGGETSADGGIGTTTLTGSVDTTHLSPDSLTRIDASGEAGPSSETVDSPPTSDESESDSVESASEPVELESGSVEDTDADSSPEFETEQVVDSPSEASQSLVDRAISVTEEVSESPVALPSGGGSEAANDENNSTSGSNPFDPSLLEDGGDTDHVDWESAETPTPDDAPSPSASLDPDPEPAVVAMDGGALDEHKDVDPTELIFKSVMGDEYDPDVLPDDSEGGESNAETGPKGEQLGLDEIFAEVEAVSPEHASGNEQSN